MTAVAFLLLVKSRILWHWNGNFLIHTSNWKLALMLERTVRAFINEKYPINTLNWLRHHVLISSWKSEVVLRFSVYIRMIASIISMPDLIYATIRLMTLRLSIRSIMLRANNSYWNVCGLCTFYEFACVKYIENIENKIRVFVARILVLYRWV